MWPFPRIPYRIGASIYNCSVKILPQTILFGLTPHSKTPVDRFRSLVPNAGRIVSLASANQSAPWERRRCFSDKDLSKVYTLIIATVAGLMVG